MFIIQTLEPALKATLPQLQNMVRDRNGLVLDDPAISGTFLTPILHPRMARQYEGFEVQPEFGVTVQAIKPPNQAMHFVNGGWSPTSATIFYSPEQIRQYLPLWQPGAIQFRVKLQATANREYPRTEKIKVGYWVDGDPLSYLLESALPDFFAVPVGLVRWVRSDVTGLHLPVPPGLKVERISAAIAFVPDLSSQSVVFVDPPARFDVATPVPSDRPVRLSFDYTPLVEQGGSFYQITELPCVTVKALEGDNYRQVPNVDSIRLAGGQSRVWSAQAIYDQPIQVTVLAGQMEDARLIGNRLIEFAENVGRVEAFPHGLEIPLQMSGVLKQGVGTGVNVNPDQSVISMNVRMKLLNLWQGVSVQDVDTVEVLEKDFMPKS